jgi:hypothetical protein
MTLPGRAVGAGRAVTVGVNEAFPPPGVIPPGLTPPGVTFFSVGVGFSVGIIVSDIDGLGDSVGFSVVVLQAARAPVTAAVPISSATPRVMRGVDIMFLSAPDQPDDTIYLASNDHGFLSGDRTDSSPLISRWPVHP